LFDLQILLIDLICVKKFKIIVVGISINGHGG